MEGLQFVNNRNMSSNFTFAPAICGVQKHSLIGQNPNQAAWGKRRRTGGRCPEGLRLIALLITQELEFFPLLVGKFFGSLVLGDQYSPFFGHQHHYKPVGGKNLA